MSDTSTYAEIEKLTHKDTQRTLELVESNYNKAKRARQVFERQWYTNLAFYFGRQWAVWQPQLGDRPARLWEPPAPPWRVRLVSNKVKPIARTEMSKLTREKPQAFVVPASSDDSDLMAARASETIFEHLWRTLHINRIMRQSAFWTINCGTSFIKDWYDKDVKDDDGTKGRIMAEVVTPFHLFVPDMAEEEIDDQPYIIHAVAKPRDWIEKTFNKKLAQEDRASRPVESSFFSALGITNNAHTDEVTVKECWIRPCPKYANGAVVTWAQDALLNVKEGWPYQHNEYPFSNINHVPTGRFYGDSVIPDLIPLQKEYNRTRSQMVEAKNRMSKPQLLAARGSVNTNKMTSEPGLIIEYTPGFAEPKPLPLQDLPAYVKEELDIIQRDMDDISSQHEITKGRTPPGVTAATAISYLQEEDDSKLSYTVSSLEEAVERVGQHFLSHVQQFWKAEKAVKVAGENGVFEIQMFKGSDIKGNTDLKIEAGSATPRSKAAKQAFITELGQMGWIQPDRALKYLDMAETGRLYEESQIDARQAQRENLRMSKVEEVVLPNTWDVHEIHIEEHNQYRKRQEFELLDDEIKVLFEEHVMLHQQAMAGQMGGVLSPEGAEMGQPPIGPDGQPMIPMDESGQPTEPQPSPTQPPVVGLPPANQNGPAV